MRKPSLIKEGLLFQSKTMNAAHINPGDGKILYFKVYPFPFTILSGSILAITPAFLFFLISVMLAYHLNYDVPSVSTNDLNIKVTINNLVLAPIIETFLLMIFILIVGSIIKSSYLISLLVATISAYEHFEFKGALAIAPSFWQFFIYSLLFIYWKNISLTKAYFAAAIPHFFLNLVATIITALQIEYLLKA